MRLRNLSNPEKLDLCRKYFFIGCFALPFVWLINFLWFYKCAYKEEHFEEQHAIRKYLQWSVIGFCIWSALMLGWNVIFQYFRTIYPEVLDYVSFVFPIGYR